MRSPVVLRAAVLCALVVSFLSAARAADTRVRVGRIEFAGNRAVSTAKLRSLMTQAHRRFLILPRAFDDLEIENDLRRVAAHYRRQGFLHARISADSVSIAGGRADILVAVSEETRYVLRSSAVEGATGGISLKEMASLLRLRAGLPYNPEEASEARSRLLRRLAESGFAFAEVQQTLSFESHSVDVNYRVSAGPLVFYRDPVIAGNRDVRDEAVRRELTLKTGAVMRRADLARTQRRLADRDLFRSIVLAPLRDTTGRAATAPVERSAVATEDADLRVSVEEKPPRWIALRAGYATTDRIHGGVEWGHRNLDGHGRRFSVEANASATRLYGAATLREPWPLSFASTGRLQARLSDDIREAFTERKTAVSTGLEIPLGDVTRGDLMLEASRAELLKVLPNAAAEVLGDIDRADYAAVEAKGTIERTTYDDRAFPRRGSATSLSMAVSFGDLQSWRFEGRAGRALPLGERLVLALGGSAGWTRGFGRTSRLPASRRFFLGGQDSLRGYRLDSVGPVDANGQPAGGEFFVLGQAEWRFFPTDRGHGVLFADAGQVARRVSEFRPRGLAFDAGAGFRYHTPFGPIRIEYAWPLGDGRLRGGRLNVTVGYAF